MASQKPSSVRIGRTFDVPAEEVWKAWTDAAVVSRWFGSDPAGTVLAAKLDVRIGGTFEVTFRDSPGTVHTCSGSYLAVEPATHLSFTWHWKSEPGVGTMVEIRLAPQGSGTRMIFDHSRLSSASAHDYEAGWQRTFDKLARVLRDDR